MSSSTCVFPIWACNPMYMGRLLSGPTAGTGTGNRGVRGPLGLSLCTKGVFLFFVLKSVRWIKDTKWLQRDTKRSQVEARQPKTNQKRRKKYRNRQTTQNEQNKNKKDQKQTHTILGSYREQLGSYISLCFCQRAHFLIIRLCPCVTWCL